MRSVIPSTAAVAHSITAAAIATAAAAVHVFEDLSEASMQSSLEAVLPLLLAAAAAATAAVAIAQVTGHRVMCESAYSWSRGKATASM